MTTWKEARVAKQNRQDAEQRTGIAGVITRTFEGGGIVSTCSCQWLRYSETTSAADDADREHLKKCKGPKQRKLDDRVTAPRSSSNWNDREDSTWIDKL